MTSATTQPASGTGGHRAEGQGYGLVLFASVLLVVVGCFNLIYGIAAVANSHVFTANAHYVFGSLRTWGWITLIIGVLQLLAAAGVLAGNQAARWFGVAVLGLSAIDQMFFIPAYPFWSLMIIAVDVVALYGLCAYGSRANLRSRLAPQHARTSRDGRTDAVVNTNGTPRDQSSEGMWGTMSEPDRTRLPIRRAAFQGVANRTLARLGP